MRTKMCMYLLRLLAFGEDALLRDKNRSKNVRRCQEGADQAV